MRAAEGYELATSLHRSRMDEGDDEDASWHSQPEGRGIDVDPPHAELHEAFSGRTTRHREEQDGADSIDDVGPDNKISLALRRRTLIKLDTILLPFLSILFLLNSLDKSNIGNAETAGFIEDTGIDKHDVNISMACFFAFFVTLQPVGAALGRRFGMARWVPACMSLWGLCTILHLWVRSRWQLIALRIAIASLEAGFYPTTVSYLSLFYTRFEFAMRLGFFYGQSAVAGALGGILSWAVFSSFPRAAHPHRQDQTFDNPAESGPRYRGWQVLFIIEGCMTITIALLGFFWLPNSANSAWFLSAAERRWAEDRMRLDRDPKALTNRQQLPRSSFEPDANDDSALGQAEDETHQHLLSGHDWEDPRSWKASKPSTVSVTADSGLDRHDIVSAILQYKIWHLLICNLLSAIPATAFGIFLPMVIKELSPSLNLSPAASNILTAPPFVLGASSLLLFTRWSDRSRQRLVPILWGLVILTIGLLMTVLTPMTNYVLRYLGLCILLSGSFIASPLTVAWISDNTPEPGKRALLLGINGWGNLAGVSSAFLFGPDDAPNGYVGSLVVTLICVIASFLGYIAFVAVIGRENLRRERIVDRWNEEMKRREDTHGDIDVPPGAIETLLDSLRMSVWLQRHGVDRIRRGDERLTYQYTL